MTLAETRETARMTARAAAYDKWVQGLREDLAEFATLTYEADTFRRDLTAGRQTAPDYPEIAKQIDVLFNRILLRLDRDTESQDNLARAIHDLMHDEEPMWVERRDAMVNIAAQTFGDEWQHTLGPSGTGSLPTLRSDSGEPSPR